MEPDPLGYYHPWEAEHIQARTHACYNEPLYAGWQSATNLLDTGELMWGWLLRQILSSVSKLNKILLVCDGGEDVPDDRSDDEKQEQVGVPQER